VRLSPFLGLNLTRAPPRALRSVHFPAFHV
jgi:hypothetical protein